MWDWDGDKIPLLGPYRHSGLATQAKMRLSLGRDLLLRPWRLSAVWITWLVAPDRPSRRVRRSAVRTTWLAALDWPSWPGRHSAVQTTRLSELDRPSRPGQRSAVWTSWAASLVSLWWLGRRASARYIFVGICVWVWVWVWGWVWMWDWDGDKIPLLGPYRHGGLATQAKTRLSLGRDLLLRPWRLSAVWITWLVVLDRPLRRVRRSAEQTTWLAALD